MTLYYLGNHREPEQLAVMRELEAAGVCVFCPAHVAPGTALHRTAHWTVLPNAYAYRGTRLHLLLVPDEHVADLTELSAAAQQDFWVALGWVREYHELTFYGLVVRNGNSAYTGGTVSHLHVHVLVGDVDDPDHQPVRIKLSSRPPTA